MASTSEKHEYNLIVMNFSSGRLDGKSTQVPIPATGKSADL